jgi:aspartate racemase
MPSMKTIGLLGGMSWESTVIYYRLMNEGVKRRLGGLHSAKILLASVEFAELAAMQQSGAWDRAADMLVGYARGLESSGAEVLLIGANTMHKVAPALEAAVRIPLLHVADAAARAVVGAGCKRPGLLGTRFTMEEPFYRERLQQRGGLDPVIPDDTDRAYVHRVIYEELCRGVLLPETRVELQRIIGRLVARGADGVILGCTELPLIIASDDAPVPVFDTTALHAEAAVDWALG